MLKNSSIHSPTHSAKDELKNKLTTQTLNHRHMSATRLLSSRRQENCGRGKTFF